MNFGSFSTQKEDPTTSSGPARPQQERLLPLLSGGFHHHISPSSSFLLLCASRQLSLQLPQPTILQENLSSLSLLLHPRPLMTPNKNGPASTPRPEHDSSKKIEVHRKTQKAKHVSSKRTGATMEEKPLVGARTTSTSSTQLQPTSRRGSLSSTNSDARSVAGGGATKHRNKWFSMLEELKEYKEQYGDCIVPRGFSDNPPLANWVAEQRKQYKLLVDGKESHLNGERVERLNQLQFSWNARTAAWDSHLANLKIFKEKYGHCHVPLKDDRYPKLGIWVKEQRRQFMLLKESKPSHMTTERVNELQELGFCWDTKEASWLERLNELKAFKEEYGSCAVPSNYLDSPKLATWVHHQRRQYKKLKAGKSCNISAERIVALENLGFVWYPRGRGRNSITTSSESSGYSSDESEL